MHRTFCSSRRSLPDRRSFEMCFTYAQREERRRARTRRQRMVSKSEALSRCILTPINTIQPLHWRRRQRRSSVRHFSEGIPVSSRSTGHPSEKRPSAHVYTFTRYSTSDGRIVDLQTSQNERLPVQRTSAVAASSSSQRKRGFL